MILRYARLAAEERADMFVVGTELFRLSGRRSEVGAGHRRSARGLPRAPDVRSQLVRFLRGSPSGTSSTTSGSTAISPRRRPEQDRHEAGIEEVYRSAHRGDGGGLWQKPVPSSPSSASLSQKGANLKPWDWKDFGALDLDVQNNYFESFLEVFGSQPWFAGLWQWCWETAPGAGGPGDKSMAVQGKPALEALKAYFAAAAAPRSLRGAWSAEQKRELEAAARRARLLVEPQQ